MRPHVLNPVLTPRDVTDIRARSVADPFILTIDGKWYMFFEIENINEAYKGEIGLALSEDGLHWNYRAVVLREAFHLSYPYIFQYKLDVYMLPESSAAYSLRLYKATDFPYRWEHIGTLMRGAYYDPSLLSHGDRIWLFTAGGDDELRLFYSNELLGEWREHPKSPIVVGDRSRARPGGRVVKHRDQIIRYAQDGSDYYGKRLKAFVVDVLTSDDYQEHEVAMRPPLQPSGTGWNAKGMHHIDPHCISEQRWIACADGFTLRVNFGWNY